MASLNRRQFVRAAAGTGLCAAVCGCASSDGGSGADARWTGPTSIDLGLAAELQALPAGLDARWVKSGGFFLVREGQRVYAVSATCTHRDCPLEADAREIACTCHGSRFTPQGQVLVGPAVRPLPRFGIATDPGGRVTVDRTRVYGPSQWDTPGAFLTL